MTSIPENDKLCELIFFDTFSHDTDEQTNLDLVQFRTSNVRIEEIRVVPLGARVEANFPNGDRLGATNPSSFDIQFYINDLTRPDVSTFTDIGSFTYQQNGNTQLIVNIQKVTDGLLIRGRYRTLTLAVFGVAVGHTVVVAPEHKAVEECQSKQENDDENILGDKRQEVIDAIMQRLEGRASGSTDRKNETPFSPDVMRKNLKSPSTSDIDSPAPEKTFKRSPIESVQATPSFDDLSASNFSDVKTPPSPIGPEDASIGAEETKSSFRFAASDDLENISPGNSSLGDGDDDAEPVGVCFDEVDGLPSAVEAEAEVISSEDDFEDFVDNENEADNRAPTPTDPPPISVAIDEDLDPISSDEDDIEPAEIDYEDKSDYLKMFDVELVDLKPLVHFSRVKTISSGIQVAEMKRFHALVSCVANFKEEISLRGKWVEVMETIVTSFDPKSLNDNCSEILIEWLLVALDFEIALQQQRPPMKLRQVKSGIRLATSLFSSTDDVVDKVISSGVLRLLLQLYKQEHMTLPVKLLILRGFDTLTDSKHGMTCATSLEIELSYEKMTIYQWLLKETLKSESSRIMSSIAAFLKKCTMYEMISKLVLVPDDEVVQLLKNLRSMLAISMTFMKQPIRILPKEKIFEVKFSEDGWNTILNWFHDLNLLETCNKLLNSANDDAKMETMELILDIVRAPKGVHFLLQNENHVHHLKSILSLMSTVDKKLHFQTTQCLHVTSLLDQVVKSILKPNGLIDASDPDAAVLLHSLFMSLFTWQGRMSIVHLLNDDEHLTQVIKIIKLVSSCSGDEEIIFEYFSRILVDYIKFQEDGILELIDRHGNDLMELSRMKDKPVFACLSSFFSNFITTPFTYSPSSFQVLSNILKRGIEQDLRTSLVSLPSIPPQIITCLRILNQVCIPPDTEMFENEDIPKQLKYKYGLAQVYSSECISHIISLLNQITNNHLSIPHVSLFTVSSYYLVLTAIKLSVVIISSTTHTLIETQGNSFQDVSTVQPLLRVYCLLSHVPDDHETSEVVDFVKDLIVHTLSMFCKLPENDKMGDSELLKSIWTKTIKEMLSYIFSSPVAMKSGLHVFSQLLPATLLVEGLGSDQDTMNLNLRKLWVVHMSPFKDQIEALGSSFCCCSDKELRKDVLTVLSKISDLSPDTSIIIVQSFMSSLNAVRVQRVQLQNYLWLLVHLLQDWSFKVTFIYLIRLESVKKESNFLHDLLLLSNPHDADVLMEIISHLLMADDQQLLNQFPKEGINTIIIFILIKLETGTLVDSPSLAKKAFKILSKFCESELGLHQLQINLKSCGKKVLNSFLNKLMSSFFTREGNSSCCDVLESFISFFTLLIKSSVETGFGLKSTEVRDLLKTDTSDPDSLDTFIRCCQVSKSSSSPQVIKAMENLECFIALLQKPATEHTVAQVEPKIFKAEALVDLFANRRHKPDFVLEESSGESVEVDLVTLGRCVSGIEFNLSQSLKDQLNALEPGKKVLMPVDKKPILQQQQLVIQAKTIASPSRGRGRGAGLRYDPFRTRPPNTSRPPSMHVDDFVALEKDPGSTSSRRMKDFQGHRTTSAPSPLYPSSSLSVDTRNVVQKGASFTHRTSPYLSPRTGASHWMKKSPGQSSLTPSEQMKRNPR